METQYVDCYIQNVKQEYNHFLDEISLEHLSLAADLIQHSKERGGRVHVTGIGKTSHVASYISALLSSTGTKAYFLDGTEAVHGSAGQVDKGDIVIAISNSGETAELKAAVTALKKIGAKIIGVSGGTHSWLSQASDVFLYAGTSQEGDRMNKPPRLSILAEITVLQCLSVLLQEEAHVTIEEYYAWHPGGSLGAAIKNQIGSE